jgi:hypothetical protein
MDGEIVSVIMTLYREIDGVNTNINFSINFRALPDQILNEWIGFIGQEAQVDEPTNENYYAEILLEDQSQFWLHQYYLRAKVGADLWGFATREHGLGGPVEITGKDMPPRAAQ